MDNETKFAHLGKPGTAFTPGFARRMKLMTEQIDFTDQKVIDVGCGEGVWLEVFSQFTDPENVFGTDIDPDSLEVFFKNNPDTQIPRDNLVVSMAEGLPIKDDMFDIVFSNEVIEHVEDDKQVISEMIRILKPGGKLIIFTPNRGWPFEQHGMFWRGKYVWGNIFLLPWLPKWFQRKFAPHVRNYWDRDIRKLLEDLPAKISFHKHVFSGFDGMVRRFGFFGRLVQRFFHLAEKTPLHKFGISHFVIIEKV